MRASGGIELGGNLTAPARTIRLLCSMLILAGTILLSDTEPSSASPADCQLGDQGTLTITLDPGEDIVMSVGEDRKILVDGQPCGFPLEATTETTARITVTGNSAGERLAIDQRTGVFRHSSTGVRIPIVVDLAAESDSLTVFGNSRDNSISVGREGLTLAKASTQPDIVSTEVESVIVKSGQGRDVLTASGSPLVGEPRTDGVSLYGDAGEDLVIGGPANDFLNGGSGDDAISGRAGNDRLRGDEGKNVLRGEAGNDSLAGSSKRDRMIGAAGADVLTGNGGPDYLDGGPNKDKLWAGNGRDTCYPGTGGATKSSCERPKTGAILPPSPAGRILVVNQNIKEVHGQVPDDIFPGYGDQHKSRELKNMARRWIGLVDYAPDLFLLQESSPRAARKTARFLSQRFRLPYRAVVAPSKSLWMHRDRLGWTVTKRNSALIMNASSMKFRNGGYLPAKQLDKDREYGVKTIQHQAYGLFNERRTGRPLAAMAIHFNANSFFKNPRLGNRRREAWTNQVARFLKNKYPAPKLRIIGGEFSHNRCRHQRWETIVCNEARFYRTITDEFGYTDAVLKANSTSNDDLKEQATSKDGRPKRVDYLFVKPNVVDASRDVTYSASKGDRNYISDHKGDWALITI